MSTIKDFNNRKEVHMIYNPRFGWCNFKLGTFFGTPSYLTDVPVDLLDAFINYYEKGSGTVVFDEEGSHFTSRSFKENHISYRDNNVCLRKGISWLLQNPDEEQWINEGKWNERNKERISVK